jgi:hypothetical protein
MKNIEKEISPANFVLQKDGGLAEASTLAQNNKNLRARDNSYKEHPPRPAVTPPRRGIISTHPALRSPLQGGELLGRAPKSPQDYSIARLPAILLEDSDGVVDRFTIGIESIESEECFMSRVPIVNAGIVVD